MTERENIADEQKGTENRALGDPLSDRGECGLMTGERDELLSVGEVGSKPVMYGPLNTELAQPLKEDGMVHCVKGCALV